MENTLNILIHGAVHGSNFGDCLYAIIYASYLQKQGYRVFFWENSKYGISSFLQDHVGCKSTDSLKNMDLLVYMPGGYFTDLSQDTKKAAKIYKKYFEIGETALKNDINISVSGVGDGTILPPELNAAVCNILNHSRSISFRSQETADYFSSFTEAPFLVASDPIFMTRFLPTPPLKKEVLEIFHRCDQNHEKKLLLHVYARNKRNQYLIQTVIPAVNKYAEKHNIHVFLVTDYRPKYGMNIRWTKLFHRLHANKTILTYESPLQLCSILKNMDCVITEKLHVGVISAMYGKSVLSFPINPHKTRRFYDLIGQSDRSVLIKDCDETAVLKKIEQYFDKPVHVPEELLNNSALHMKELLLCAESIQNTKSGKNK